MEFIHTEDTQMVTDYFDTTLMLERFEQLGVLDQELSEDYGENVTNMCNLATAYMGMWLMNTYGVELKVHEGVFNMMGNHTWMSISDFIIDPTLAQFMPTAPEIAFVSHDAPEYKAVRTYFFDDWAEQLEG